MTTDVRLVQLMIAVSVVVITLASVTDAWEYSGHGNENYWKGECKNDNQSPVDIDTEDLKFGRMGPITFSGYKGKHKEKVTITNNGETLQVTFPEMKASIRVPHLQNMEFPLNNIHFHWGRTNYMGSEHTINRERFSLEMHAVHMNSENGKIVMVSKLFKASRSSKKSRGAENQFFKHILGVVEDVMKQNMSHETELNMKHRSIDKLFRLDEKMDLKGYCTYTGSLTTPPCTEGVEWIIHNTIGVINVKYLQKLRRLRYTEGECVRKPCKGKQLVNNFRTTKPLNGRTIKCNVSGVKQ